LPSRVLLYLQWVQVQAHLRRMAGRTAGVRTMGGVVAPHPLQARLVVLVGEVDIGVVSQMQPPQGLVADVEAEEATLGEIVIRIGAFRHREETRRRHLEEICMATGIGEAETGECPRGREVHPGGEVAMIEV